MKRLATAFCFCLAVVFSLPSLAADEHGTPDDAKAMVLKAVQYMKENGPEKTFAAVMDPNGGFHNKDIYVFIHDTTGLVKAHGGFPAYVGRNTVGVTDVDGKPFVKEITEVKDSGWIDYKWQNPQTKAVAEKTVYVANVSGLLICAGAYKN